MVDDFQLKLEEMGLNKKVTGDGKTAKEISKMLNYSISWVTRIIQKAVDNGVMEYAGKKETKDITGKKVLVPVYRFITKKK